MDIVLQQLEPLLAALRPHLAPITAQLPASIANPISDLITPVCYNTLILKLDPASSPACTQLALSKAIGVGIITLSTIIKVPQLIKLLNSGSARGVSFSSYALETAGYLCTLAYNFRSGNPISTYGEIGLIAVQNVVIAVLILHYSGKDMWAAAFVPVVAASLYALFSEGVVDAKLMGYLQAATIPLTLASKVPQIISVARNKSTGNLSAFAVCILKCGLGELVLTWWLILVIVIGIQLPLWLARSCLYDPGGGGGPAHLVRVPWWRIPELCAGGTDGLVLELGEEARRRDAGKEAIHRPCEGQGRTKEEGLSLYLFLLLCSCEIDPLLVGLGSCVVM